MKKILFTLLLLALSLAACAPAVTPATALPASTDILAPGEATAVLNPAATEAVAPPAGKLPAPTFDAQTYIDQNLGFALEYPATWAVKETMSGDRGSQSVLLSSPEVADLEVLPAGATRISVSINQWDPKGDLNAFVENRKNAWSASGFTILSEEPITLDLGLEAIRFTVQTADGLTAMFQFSAIGDQYLTLSGEGDLTLAAEIMSYLRPIK